MEKEQICQLSSSTDLRRLHIIDANPAKKFSAAALFLIFALYRAHKERGIIFNNFLKKCGGKCDLAARPCVYRTGGKNIASWRNG